MPALQPPAVAFGWKAPDFTLPATDGKTYSLKDVRGEKGTLIMFICNHCPFVQAIVDRIVEDAKALQAEGIGIAAIMSNDVVEYPDDDFENMKKFAAAHGFTFPYLFDETQAVARAYDAVCTPDFFGFNAADELQYRGRLDESRMQPVPNAARELLDAMRKVADTGKGPEKQNSSIGCSIKWKQVAA